MVFEADKFLESPDLDQFDQLRKEDLILLARHVKITFRTSMRKQTIKNLIIDHLVASGIFDEDALELKVESADSVKLKQLEFEHALEMKKIRNSG